MSERTPALMPDGKPHPFIWYGPESPWIENELGVFHSPQRLDLPEFISCLKDGCDWETVEHQYSPEIIAAAEKPDVHAYLPKVTLKCRRCNATAHPWKLWSDT